MNLEKNSLEQKVEGGRLSQKEAKESVKELQEKMDKMVVFLSEDGNEELFESFYDKIRELLGKIRDAHPDCEDYSAYHPLSGGSISPAGCRYVDFPEPELSVKAFINKEYKNLFPDENKEG